LPEGLRNATTANRPQLDDFQAQHVKRPL